MSLLAGTERDHSVGSSSALAVVVSLIFNPTNEPDAGPRWLHLFCAVCMFAYQTLDNMDGKQARKIELPTAWSII